MLTLIMSEFKWQTDRAACDKIELLIPLSHRSSLPASILLLRMRQAHAWSCDNIRESSQIQRSGGTLCFL